MIGYGASGTTHDFFAHDAAGVWNGSAFVAWVNANYATYRIVATETGASGRFTGTTPAGAVYYELRIRSATLAGSVVVWTDAVKVPATLDAADVIGNLPTNLILWEGATPPANFASLVIDVTGAINANEVMVLGNASAAVGLAGIGVAAGVTGKVFLDGSERVKLNSVQPDYSPTGLTAGQELKLDKVIELSQS